MSVSKVPLHVGSILLCGVDFPTVLERLTIFQNRRDFLSNFTVQSSHTGDLWKFSKILHTTVRRAHTGIFSSIVILQKKTFFSHRKLPQYMAHIQGVFPHIWGFSEKINLLWYESFEKTYKGFSWAPPTNIKCFYLQKLTWTSYCFCTIWENFPGATPRTPNIYRVKWH